MYYSEDFVIYRESRELKRFGCILAIIQQDNWPKIKIQRILIYAKLPKNLQSNHRKQRSQEGEVWFLDRKINNAIMNVELQVIIKRVIITVLYNDNVTNCNTIKINEILYKYNGH